MESPTTQTKNLFKHLEHLKDIPLKEILPIIEKFYGHPNINRETLSHLISFIKAAPEETVTFENAVKSVVAIFVSDISQLVEPVASSTPLKGSGSTYFSSLGRKTALKLSPKRRLSLMLNTKNHEEEGKINNHEEGEAEETIDSLNFLLRKSKNEVLVKNKEIESLLKTAKEREKLIENLEDENSKLLNEIKMIKNIEREIKNELKAAEEEEERIRRELKSCLAENREFKVKIVNSEEIIENLEEKIKNLLNKEERRTKGMTLLDTFDNNISISSIGKVDEEEEEKGKKDEESNFFESSFGKKVDLILDGKNIKEYFPDLVSAILEYKQEVANIMEKNVLELEEKRLEHEKLRIDVERVQKDLDLNCGAIERLETEKAEALLSITALNEKIAQLENINQNQKNIINELDEKLEGMGCVREYSNISTANVMQSGGKIGELIEKRNQQILTLKSRLAIITKKYETLSVENMRLNEGGEMRKRIFVDSFMQTEYENISDILKMLSKKEEKKGEENVSSRIWKFLFMTSYTFFILFIGFALGTFILSYLIRMGHILVESDFK